MYSRREHEWADRMHGVTSIGHSLTNLMPEECRDRHTQAEQNPKITSLDSGTTKT